MTKHIRFSSFVILVAILLAACASLATLTTLVAYAQTADATVPAALPIANDLDVGSQGGEVTTLQRYLASDGALYPEGLVTGYYGTLTEAAVMRFQARHGIAQVGRVGPITRAKLAEVMGVSGIGGSDDVSAPILGADTVAVGDTSATIRWSSNEPAWSRVMYGTSWPFLYASAPSAKDGSFDLDNTVTLSGLAPSTLYYYVRESVDATGNMTLTVKETFVTAASSATSATATGTTSSIAAPVISGIATQSVTSSGSILTWNTSTLTRSKIFIGTSSPVPVTTTANWSEDSYGTAHAASLYGLTASTTYFFVIVATDSFGNSATSTESSFTTAASSGSY